MWVAHMSVCLAHEWWRQNGSGTQSLEWLEEVCRDECICLGLGLGLGLERLGAVSRVCGQVLLGSDSST
jgi:hypothetical protein